MEYRFMVYRYKRGWSKPRYKVYSVEAYPEDFVIDVLEKIRFTVDSSLTFNHACHHGVCGACGMVINGEERLACITRLGELGSKLIVIEPLRGFPVISDLVVDFSRMFSALSEVKPIALEKLGNPEVNLPEYASIPQEKLEDCIECGICYSACPIANTFNRYIGPAALAAASRVYDKTGDVSRVRVVDRREGLWSCHAAFECSVKCPVDYKPGEKIMVLRRKLLLHSFRRILSWRKVK